MEFEKTNISTDVTTTSWFCPTCKCPPDDKAHAKTDANNIQNGSN